MFFKSIFKWNKEKLQEEFQYKHNINNWMKLTKEERLKIDSKEKYESMRKKKALLKSIRDEYIKLKRKSN